MAEIVRRVLQDIQATHGSEQAMIVYQVKKQSLFLMKVSHLKKLKTFLFIEAPRCQPNEFSTTINYPTCLPCFCNGLNVQCVSSSLVYNKIKSTFQTNDEDWKIIDDLKNEKPFSVDK